MSELETVLTSIAKFSDLVKWFVEKLEKTPAEEVSKIINDMNEAFEKARNKGDTSDLETLISNG